ncbi:MAG: DUF2062 domain-containing protein [Nitrospirales bacterium]|nr:DUF2062 domain-containing protein [Nitrospira sp.]MDR4502382.1 DUF2062 domain-containing protein [Nitrospirales bacterium]
MLSIQTVRDQLIQVLHLKESPQRTAIAFAIGVFIAFAPHYGFHTISVVFLAWALRLNYLAMFMGAFINNPWTIAPILGLTLYTGFTFYGSAPTSDLDFSSMHLDNIFELLTPYLLPFILGGCVLGLLGAILAYPIMLFVILRYRSARTP